MTTTTTSRPTTSRPNTSRSSEPRSNEPDPNTHDRPRRRAEGRAEGRREAKLRRSILRTMARRSFCILASTSAAGRSHSAGVIYQWVDGALWIHSTSGSRKVRNMAANPHVGVAIPYRRLPAGPPFTIHFQGVAEVMAMDAPEVAALLDAGRLDSISGHGALDMADGCFVVIRPTGSIHSYGPAARVIDLVRDPLHHGFHSFDVDEALR